jgi:Domain of unknown function (DUF4189)
MRRLIGLVAGIATVVIGLGAAVAAQDGAAPPKRAAKEPVGYGAIAYDEYAGKKGAAWDQASQAAAEKAALKQCGGKDCQVHAVRPHYCAALARSDKDKAWGGAERETVDDAKSEAIAHCQTHTQDGTCEVQVSGCNK